MVTDRYARQILLPQIQRSGQDRLGMATVLLVGVGALGCTVADLLVRAGVGTIVLIDRDIVEKTNLHRQSLFDESDAEQHLPKSIAAARRLRKANPQVRITPQVIDVTADNIRHILSSVSPTVMVDGTDNVETRYLLNDLSIESGTPWVYGAATGVEGRVMTVIPNHTPCLRCIFPTPPAPGELPTCDTVGVLNSVSTLVASLQATEVIRLIVQEDFSKFRSELISLDGWNRRFRTIDLTNGRRSDCPACVNHKLDFLNHSAANAVTLCGRNTVQIRLPAPSVTASDFFMQVVRRLEPVVTELDESDYRVWAKATPDIELSIFADGRVLVHGTSDPSQARSIVARLLG
ncbi:MAG: thiazole biosynthesis adenylyltransferase ThiF [Phycisphaerae bacterium]|jgi:adenylyltransferase/sulfurtransferase|nr:MAG: thiazole biosynthesis adenylyltransferase ThiF [Phycisphaerae bacterium]